MWVLLCGRFLFYIVKAVKYSIAIFKRFFFAETKVSFKICHEHNTAMLLKICSITTAAELESKPESGSFGVNSLVRSRSRSRFLRLESGVAQNGSTPRPSPVESESNRNRSRLKSAVVMSAPYV